MPYLFPKLRTLNKPILREEVYLSLKEAILTGEIAPGERLNISRLLKEIGFSPTPIREALIKLEQEGFVGRLPKGGFIVTQFTKKDIQEIFGIRSLLESYAVVLALPHIKGKDIIFLEKNIQVSEEYLQQKKLNRVSALNTEFHDYLNRLSQNERLVAIINELRDKIFQYRSTILRVPGMANVSVEHHKRMVRAIKKKDAHSLEALTYEHTVRGRDIIMAEIEKGNINTIKS